MALRPGRKLIECVKAPCKSCPYRRDVPSGVWAANEYDKLPSYDGTIIDQINGGVALFYCHSDPEKLCGGWLGAHKPYNLLAVRIAVLNGRVDEAVLDYRSPVPLFRTGAEAAAHGKREIKRPGTQARRTIERLVRKRERRNQR